MLESKLNMDIAASTLPGIVTVGSGSSFANTKSVEMTSSTNNSQTLYTSATADNFVSDDGWTWCAWVKRTSAFSLGDAHYIGSVNKHGANYLTYVGNYARGIVFTLNPRKWNGSSFEYPVGYTIYYSNSYTFTMQASSALNWAPDDWIFLAYSINYSSDPSNPSSILIHVNGTSNTPTHPYLATRMASGIPYSSMTGRKVTFGYIDVASTTYGPQLGLRGSIDECAMYNKALTHSQLVEIYNSGVPLDLTTLSTSDDLTGWWRCGDGDSDNVNKIYDQVSSIDSHNLTTSGDITIVEDVP